MSDNAPASVPQNANRRLSVAVVLPGLHLVNRGAEVALESIAIELSQMEDFEVTLFGMGSPRADRSYRFVHVPGISRSWFRKFPSIPLMRDETVWEELSFAMSLRRRFIPSEFDVVISCSYPFINWLISRGTNRQELRPQHIFVTQNGDWPARCNRREYRYFHCDALICTNPDFVDANFEKWPCTLIPNGVDVDLFCPGDADRASFGLPNDVPVVLMVSALISSKRVMEGIRAVARLEDAHLVIAGEGPLMKEVQSLGRLLLGTRFHLLQIEHRQMPSLYRSANVLLHMSLDEPFGIAYVEAMSIGVPVVTHDCRVTRWMLNGTGHLVDTTSEAAVISALKTAVCCRSKASEAISRDRAKAHFNWKSVALKYAAVARSLFGS